SDTHPTNETNPLSLHDALPILQRTTLDSRFRGNDHATRRPCVRRDDKHLSMTESPDHFAAYSFVDRIDALEPGRAAHATFAVPRSEEHTSELQSRSDLVCRLLL